MMQDKDTGFKEMEGAHEAGFTYKRMMQVKATDPSSSKSVPQESGFTDIVFSWSLEDIFNENLFKDKVIILLWLN